MTGETITSRAPASGAQRRSSAIDCDDRGEHQEYGMGHIRERNDAACNDRCQGTNAGDHRAAIHAIRQTADGVLRHHGG